MICRLWQEQGDKDTSQLARELGVRRNQLYKWKVEVDTHGVNAFPGKGGHPKNAHNGNTTALEVENRRLREENEIIKMGNRGSEIEGLPSDISRW